MSLLNLYNPSSSLLNDGSNWFRIPNRVYDKASETPAIGRNTAIGNALITALV